MVAGASAEQLPDRNTERLRLDVPKGEIYRSEGMNLLAAGWIEVPAVHQLPEMLDAKWILADDHRAELSYRVLRTALSDSGDADIGFDCDDV